RAPPTLRPPRLGVPVRRSHWPARRGALRPLAEAGSGEPCAQRWGGVSRRAVCTPRVAQAAGPAGPSEQAELSRAGAAAAGNRTAGFQFMSSSLPDICYRCGESGHLAKDCDLQEDEGSRRCGETGHVAINCSKTSEVNCYRCGESGHLARECTIEATA
ncbi:hypothetical protein IHE44_0003361, partial [Lamprotornis superbus]